MCKLSVKKEYLEELLTIFNNYCPNGEIWAYGSRVNESSHEGSDLDLVVKDFGDENCSIVKLKTIIQESNIPFLIDISEFNSIPDAFKNEIEKNYVVIYPVDEV